MVWDVVVVGAGLSGSLLSEILAEAGLSVLVLEAGERPRKGFKPPVVPTRLEMLESNIEAHLPDRQDWDFSWKGVATKWIRVREDGGRSLLWGGWFIPPDERILKDAARNGAPWPLKFEELQRGFDKLTRRVSRKKEKLHSSLQVIGKLAGTRVLPKPTVVDPSGKRPLIASDLRNKAQVRHRTVVVGIDVTREGSLRGVECKDSVTRKSFGISARSVVLCASPIESARLVLASERLHDRLDNENVGKGLVDHIHVRFDLFMPMPKRASLPISKTAYPTAGGYFIMDSEGKARGANGFAVEVREAVDLSRMSKSFLEPREISRELARDGILVRLGGMGDMGPSRKRFVRIDSSRRDRYGRPVPVIHWAWGAQERRTEKAIDDLFLDIASDLASPGSTIIRSRGVVDPYVLMHEAGTLRMGKSARTSVTNSFGAFHSMPGLYAADASIMPTALDRHPTATILTLTLRVAEGIVRDFREGRIRSG